MSLKLVRAAGIAALLLSGAAFPALADDPVVAVVNGKEIKRSALEEIHKLSPLGQMKLQEAYPQLMDIVLGNALITEQANKAKIGEDPMVKAQIRLVQNQIIQQAYLQRKVDEQLTDAVLKKEYDKLKGREQVHAKHILLEKEDEAKQVIKDLKGGAKFEDLAKAKSKDPSGAENGGDLGFFFEDEMVPEFSAAAFKMKKGELSDAPVKSQFGWHVIQVLERRAAPLPPFDEAKPRLKKEMGQQVAQKIVGDLFKAADIKVFDLNGKPLPQAPAQGGDAPAAAPATGGAGGIPVKP